MSDQPIVCYSQIQGNGASGASLIFPVNTLGRKYTAVSYNQLSTIPKSVSYCCAIASEDNTVINVTLPAGVATQTHAAGSTFTQTLNKGEVLTLLSNQGVVYSSPYITASNTLYAGQDLTGTVFESISSGPNGCKRIAVFSGSSNLAIACENYLLTAPSISTDNLYQQMIPQQAWGKKYITIPTTSLPNNIYRIIVSDTLTVVKRNGVQLPFSSLINHLYYQYISDPAPPAGTTTTAPSVEVIDASKPVMVAQFITSRLDCGNYSTVNPNNDGDPEMIILSPVEQGIDRAEVYSTQYAAIDTSYINVAIKTTGVTSFKLDGTTRVPAFSTVPFDAAYSYAKFKVTQGLHTLKSDSTFNAIAYGYGPGESYGYNAGANAKNLYQFISINNPLGGYVTRACKGTPMNLSVTLPYRATSLTWDFGNNPNLVPSSTIFNNNPVPDSNFVLDGDSLFVYKLTGLYTFNAVGIYPVIITANNPTPDGCSGLQTIPFSLEVIAGPTIDFSYVLPTCASDSVRFTDLSVDTNSVINRWSWDFGNGVGTSSIQNPAYVYGSGGTYFVKLRGINRNGCYNDLTKSFTLTGTPITKFGYTGSACVGTALTFKDSSTITGGTITKAYWDFGDGIKDTVATASTLTHSYTAAGTYTVTLQSVGSTGCTGNYALIINVGATPVADFAIPGNVCLPGGATFTNQTTVTGALPLNYVWDFGDATATVTSPASPTHVYANAGSYQVTLTASSFNCVSTITKTFATVYNKPTALYSVNPSNCWKDSTSFTDNSTGNGTNVVGWNWIFGDGTTGTLQNPKHLYAAPGTYTIKLVVTSDKGCISDTISKQVVVNSLPVAGFTYLIDCSNRKVTFTDTSSVAGGIIRSWHWNMGDGLDTVTHNSNSFSHIFPLAGVPYTVTLSDTSNSGCYNQPPFQKIITVSATPNVSFTLPGNICLPNAAATFVNTSQISDGTLMTYVWNFGDGPSVAADSILTPAAPAPITHTYTTAGSFPVKLTATSAGGCVHDTTIVYNGINTPPIADFTIPATGCVSDSVSFTDLSAPLGAVNQWNWDFGDGGTSNIRNPKHLFLVPGTYHVTLTVGSASICPSVPFTKDILIGQMPVAVFSAPAVLCANKTVTFTDASIANSPGGLTEWHWDFGDNQGPILQTGTGDAVHTYPAAGTYPVKLYVLNSNRCSSPVVTQLVTINPLPVPDFSAVGNCSSPSPASMIFTAANNSSVTVTNWGWEFGTIPPSFDQGQFVTHNYAQGGPYNVTLVELTANGCADSISKTIQVMTRPTAKDSIVNLNNLCSSQPVTVINNSVVANVGSVSKVEVYWDWLNNPSNVTVDTLPQLGSTYNHAYPVFGSPDTVKYTITLIAYNLNGCSDTTQQVINLKASPKLNFDAAFPVSVCQEHIPFDIVDSLGAHYVFEQFNLGSFSGVHVSGPGIESGSTIFNPALAPTGPNTLTFSDTALNGCYTDTTRTIVVLPTPAITFASTYAVEEGYSIVPLKPTTPMDPNLIYHWSPATFLNDTTLFTPDVLLPTSDIVYTLKVQSLNGCTDSMDITINLLTDFPVYNTFTPNSDSRNDYWEIPQLTKYPDHHVEIFNRYGQLVFETRHFTHWDGTYKGKTLPEGTYYYVIELGGVRKPKTGYVTIIK